MWLFILVDLIHIMAVSFTFIAGKLSLNNTNSHPQYIIIIIIIIQMFNKQSCDSVCIAQS